MQEPGAVGTGTGVGGGYPGDGRGGRSIGLQGSVWVAPGILRLSLPTPYPVGDVNVYAVLGAVPTLVDVGPATGEAWEALTRGLAEHGLEPRDFAQVVITHTHADHFTQLPRFLAAAAERGGGGGRVGRGRPLVAAHRWGARSFRGGDDPQRVDFFRRFARMAGVPEAEVEGMLRVLAGLLALEPRLAVDRWLDDGDVIAMGDDRWRVLHTPGHAQSQICLYRERDGVLISSDHLLPAISSNALAEPPPLDEEGRPARTEPPRSLVDYRASLGRVRSLPAPLCLPGHGEPFRDHRGLVDERLAAMDARAAQIADALEELGGTATLYDLAVHLFGRGQPAHLMLALSEVNGHVEWMEAEGRIQRRPGGHGGEVALFAPVGRG
ncbi:MAG TPA: MBL fold metallo-hydrolase [Thermaerobacter sp.]